MDSLCSKISERVELSTANASNFNVFLFFFFFSKLSSIILFEDRFVIAGYQKKTIFRNFFFDFKMYIAKSPLERGNQIIIPFHSTLPC